MGTLIEPGGGTLIGGALGGIGGGIVGFFGGARINEKIYDAIVEPGFQDPTTQR